MSTVTKLKSSLKYLMLLLTIPAYWAGIEYGKLEVQYNIRANPQFRVFVTAACGELAEDAPNLRFVENGIANECEYRVRPF